MEKLKNISRDVSKKTPRESNLELLRILAMFGVLIVHADFGALGWPDGEEFRSIPYYSVVRTLIESFALVCVNVFVLISGWFGIRFKWKGLIKLLFQCGFFFFGIYFTLILCGLDRLSLSGLYKCLMFSDNAWFVKCYIGLLILAPVLNSFVEKVDRKTFKTVLILFFVFQSAYGWLSNGAAFIKDGYSTFSFMGLYLLARYIKTYSPRWSKLSVKSDIVLYIVFSLVTAMLLLVSLYADKSYIASIFFKYSSVFIIAASLFLVIGFGKKKFYNKTINSVATSCFAVYLFHFMLFPRFVSPAIREAMKSSNYGIVGGVKVFSILVVFFLCAIVLDKIRLLVYNRLIAPLVKNL